MSNAAERSPAGPRSTFPTLATILLALSLFAGLWFAAQALAGAPRASAEDTSQADTAAVWPTVPPTITPHPATAGMPMPTPIPLPRWEEQRELIVGTFTLATVQEAEVAAGRTWSLDKTALLRLTYKVEMTVDLSKLGPGSVQRDGNTIAVIIPPPAWKKPVFDGILSLEREHHTTLFPEGPPAQVIGKGITDVVKQLEANPGLRRLAYDAARTQVTELLKDLGFRQVTVTIGQ